MKKTIILILFYFLNQLILTAEISLFDCIDSALENSFEIKNADKNVIIYKSKKLNNLYDFIPDVTAYSSAKRDIDGNDIGTNNISVSENLYLFDERFFNYKLTNLDYQKEKLNFQEERQSTVLDILQLYSDLLTLRETLDYYHNSAEFYNTEMEFIREMMKTGKRTELDLYSTEIELKNAELNITRTENDLVKKLLELSQKTGKIYKNTTQFSDITDLIPLQIGNISFENNLDWGKMILTRKQRKIEKNIYFKRIFPDLYVNGYYNWRDVKYWKDADKMFDYEGNFIIRDQETDYWEISLNISYSLSSFAKKLTDYHISKIRLKQEDFNLASLQQNLQKELESRRLDLNLKQDEIEIGLQKLALAEKKFQLVLEKFRSGLVSFLDFKTTHNETLNARIELLQARYDYIIAFAEWQKVKGERIFGRY
ncbi:MAG: TolC family protein [Candidatus Cloacimonetes bacterium]|nr:TolC family protein [Candidatus Cloacimonadota bacterium]